VVNSSASTFVPSLTSPCCLTARTGQPQAPVELRSLDLSDFGEARLLTLPERSPLPADEHWDDLEMTPTAWMVTHHRLRHVIREMVIIESTALIIFYPIPQDHFMQGCRNAMMGSCRDVF
jgi:hypothetical protein